MCNMEIGYSVAFIFCLLCLFAGNCLLCLMLIASSLFKKMTKTLAKNLTIGVVLPSISTGTHILHGKYIVSVTIVLHIIYS